MALTYTINENLVTRNKRVVFASIAFDASYVSGGYSISAAKFGLNSISHVSVSYPGVIWDKTNSKLKVVSLADTHAHNIVTANSAAGTALTGAANALNANTASFTITGGGTSGIQNNTAGTIAANSGAVEIAATTDLSGITIQVIVIGT